MALRLNTTSQLISFHTELENKTAEYYCTLANLYPEYANTFIKLSEENKKHKEQVITAYRLGVTDAFEVGFSTNPLDPSNYKLTLKGTGTLIKDIYTAIENEKRVIKFCLDAIKTSNELLPDIPNTFEYLVRRKKKRIKLLSELS
jgi:hypothetical protein